MVDAATVAREEPDESDGTTRGPTPVLSMTWRDALFLHWPVAPERVADHLPEGVEVATHDGRAWMSVVGFEMANVAPRGIPFGLTFPELNLRTYVERDGVRGVYFFNLDAADPLGAFVARRLFALPYYRADMRLRRRGEERRLTSHRVHRGAPAAHFDADYRPLGERFTPDPGTLEHFLVENYRFYTRGDRGLYYGDIDHAPWRLRGANVDVHTNTLFEANGFDRPEGDPLIHFSATLDVVAGRLHRA